MRRHPHGDVEVAGWPTAATRSTPALETQLLTVVDSGLDPHLHLPVASLDAAAPARGTGRLDDGAAATTAGTGAAEGEEALVVVEDAPPATLRAGAGRRARCRSAA